MHESSHCDCGCCADAHFGALLNQTSRLIRRALDARINAEVSSELSGVRGMVLGDIVRAERQGRDVYQRDIEQWFNIRRSSVTAMLQGMEQDGSSTGFFYLEQVSVSLQDGHARLTLGAGHIETLANMLRARLGKGRPLFLQGGEAAVQFLSGKPELWEEDGVLTMSMPGETVEELCGLLRPHAGEYPLTSYPLTVELIPTQIRDAQGNVLREIG